MGGLGGGGGYNTSTCVVVLNLIFFIVCDFVEREYVLLTCCLTDVEYCTLQNYCDICTQ